VVTGTFTAPAGLSRTTFRLSSTGAFIDWPATGQRIVTPLIHGIPICATPPTNGQVLAWDAVKKEYCPETLSAIDDDTADMQDVTSGPVYTVPITKVVTQVIWRWPTSTPMFTNIPGSTAGNNGYSLDVKLTMMSGQTNTVTPASGTIGGQPNWTFKDDHVGGCNMFLRSDGINNDWIIRCICCFDGPLPAPPPPITCEPSLVYSVRKVVSSYAGDLFTIRRSTDNVTQAFAPSGVDAPQSAITSFLGGATGYIFNWNDQSGNGWDAGEDLINWGNGPVWFPNRINGHPGLRFSTYDGLHEGILIAHGVAFATAQWTVFAVVQMESVLNADTYPDIIHNSTIAALGDNTFQPYWAVNLIVAPYPGPPTGVVVATNANDSTNSKQNGFSATAAGPGIGVTPSFDIIELQWGFVAGAIGKLDNAGMTGLFENPPIGGDFNISPSDVLIGADQSNNGDLFTGIIVELQVYNCLLTANERETIRNNIASYYNITLTP